ncbi:MAG: hypothetical protein WKF75_18120, partial [Singulisphaera sp.]
LESFKLVGDGRRGTANQREVPLSSFTWNETIFKSFQAGYIKQLDLKFYLRLIYPTSKRIFRFLDKRFYHRPEWEFDLREFAFVRVGLSRNYEGNIQIARKLEPAIRELEEQGFPNPCPTTSGSSETGAMAGQLRLQGEGQRRRRRSCGWPIPSWSPHSPTGA